jgi:deoxycytidine triphosphate deaminase
MRCSRKPSCTICIARDAGRHRAAEHFRRRHRAVDRPQRRQNGLVGYRGKHHTGLVDVDKRAAQEVVDFWEPIHKSGAGELVLDPDEFYILVSQEAVHVPPLYAAEMTPFDPLVGEFRVHYAGFFDPGFGHSASGGTGSRAVLEVRSHEVPFILDHGQIVGRLVYEPRPCQGAGGPCDLAPVAGMGDGIAAASPGEET